MSSIYRRGGSWVLEYWTDGEKKVISTGISVASDPTKKMAELFRKDFELKLARQAIGIEDTQTGLAQAINSYADTKRKFSPGHHRYQVVRAKRWIDWLGKKGVRVLEDVTPKMLDDFILERQKAGLAHKTVKEDIDFLRAVARTVNKGKQHSRIPVESWPRVDRTTSSRPETVGAYQVEEVEAMLRYFEEPHRAHLRPLVMMLAYTGARWSELERLKVGDVHLGKSPYLRIESKKTGRNLAQQFRNVPIHPSILPIVKEHAAGKAVGDPLLHLPGSHGLTERIALACKKLSIRYKRTHGFRHFFASEHIKAGVPIFVIMKLLGHRNLSTTQRYADAGEDFSEYASVIPAMGER